MQSTTHVLFASVLKPVDDVRTYHKLGKSLIREGEFRITIAGYASKKTPKNQSAELINLFSGKRGHLGRILTYFKLFRLIRSLKPDIVVTSTYELIPATLAAKGLQKFIWFYDVQENYRSNLRHNLTSPPFLRGFAIAWVRLLEKIARPFIKHYLLAEKCYLKELPGFRPATVVENKALEEFSCTGQKGKPLSSPLAFVLAGTAAKAYGTDLGLSWFESYLQTDQECSLSLVGHCPSFSFLKELKDRFGHLPQVNWNLHLSPLPHAEVMETVKQADIWLMPYQPLPSIVHKIPSKMYEALALQKPLLITHNPKWSQMIKPYPAGIGIDFIKTEEAPSHVRQLLALELYRNPVPNWVFWRDIAPKVVSLFKQSLEGNRP
ncbi:glycosyltransferase family protein [Pleomorphovibrio marinus]|uniref:glycosyltransferase n=1 Tax=Pleomorphovibrio marinus TaxID=2164132 RepID=UPI000E0BCA18|nr:glycosyltransferase [Pleomorphovibrio marinus]